MIPYEQEKHIVEAVFRLPSNNSFTLAAW